jgi:hypothetical protein
MVKMAVGGIGDRIKINKVAKRIKIQLPTAANPIYAHKG